MQRTNVLKVAKITLDGSVRTCIVQDICSLGARLAFVSTAHIPETFDLTFDGARTLRPCRTVWRTATQIGIEFHKASFRPAAVVA